MSSLEFLTFDLLIERVGDGYRARVLNSPAGQASTQFTSPFGTAELASFFGRVGQRGAIAGTALKPEELVKQFGGKLFDAALNGEVVTSYRRSLDAAAHDAKGLRIRLRLNDVPELADLPWEYLYDATRQNFLALSQDTPIVRYLELPEPVAPLAAPSPLNLLAVLSSPTDYDTLDVEGEWARMQDALSTLQKDGAVTLTRVEPPTLDALLDQLRKSDYHVLHFIGHGEYDAQAQCGALVFEDAQGKGIAVSDEQMATLLRDARTMRAVLLNSCEGARTSQNNPFAGVAPSLVQAGIPAVLAMQFPISDPAAIHFSTEFYRTLADNYPVDAAVNEARRAIYLSGDVLEFGTAVLFMRAEDGQVFSKEDSVGEGGKQAAGGSHGGINISGDAHVSAGRDFVGGDKIVNGDDVAGDVNTVTIGAGAQVGQVAAGRNIQQTHTEGTSANDLAKLFQQIYAQVDARPDDPNVAKSEIKEQVKQIEAEAAKGAQANPTKIERWLKTLQDIAPDILDVTAAALLNPLAGVAKAIALIAQRVRDGA